MPRQAPPTDTRWFLISVDANYNGIKAQAEAKHVAARPGHILSVYENNAGTQALIKVEGPGGWQPPPPSLVRVFTRDDHNEAQAMMYLPEWDRSGA